MSRLRLALRAIGCASLLAAAPVAGAAAAELSFAPPATRTLGNGLVVAVFSEPGDSLVQVQVRLPAGTIHEGPDQVGAARLTAQMIRHGTTSRDARTLSSAIARLGGSIAATAHRDYAVVASVFLTRDLEPGMELVSDLVRNAVLRDVDFEVFRGRAIAYAERKPAAEDADDRLWGVVFGDHPYARPLGGMRAGLQRLTHGALRTFYRERYRPKGAVLVISGGVEPADAFAAAERQFGAWVGESPRSAPPAPSKPAGNPIVVIDRPGETIEFRFGWLLPGKSPRDEATLAVFAALLEDSLRSALPAAWVPHVGLSLQEVGGLGWVSARVPADSLGPGFDRVRQEIASFLATPPGAIDVRSAARRLREGLVLRWETWPARLAAWQAWDAAGHAADLWRHGDRLGAVSAEAVREAAQNAFGAERIRTVVSGPADAIRAHLRTLGVQELGGEPAPAGRPAQVLPTAEEQERGRAVIKAALQAHGGRKALEGIRDSRVHADLSLRTQGPDATGSLMQVRKEPDRMVIETLLFGVTRREILNGDSAWMVVGEDPVRSLEPPTVAELREGFRMNVPHLLLAAADPAAVVADQGKVSAGGRELRSVAVVAPGSPGARTFFFDDRNRLAAIEQRERDPRGRIQTLRRAYDDYRSIAGGVLWPFAEDRLIDQERFMRIRVRSVALNGNVPDSEFDKPRTVHAVPRR